MRVVPIVSIAVILGGIGYLVYGGLGQNLVYFVTPSEYLENPAEFQDRELRLGGLVKPETVQYDPQTLELEFILTDGASEIPVVHRGTPPELFQAGQGVIVEGNFKGTVFAGKNLLVKHSENYTPPRAEVP